MRAHQASIHLSIPTRLPGSSSATARRCWTSPDCTHHAHAPALRIHLDSSCIHIPRFFKRYNKALLDKSAIDREQARLSKENEDLRQLLKGFLDGISVNDAVINNPANPLLVVNQRLQLTMAERRKAAAAAAAARGGGGAGGGGLAVQGQQAAAAARAGR